MRRKQEIRRIVESFASSGKTRREYCEEHGISITTLDDGGARERGHCGGEKRASSVVAQWPVAGVQGADCDLGGLSGGMVFRSFRLLGSIGPAFDLQNDRTFDQAVEESHRQRTVREIVSPLIKIHVGDQRRGALLIA